MYNSAPTEYSENMASPNSVKFPEKLQKLFLCNYAGPMYYDFLLHTLLMPYINYFMGKSTLKVKKSLPTSMWSYYINQCSMC